MVDGNDKYSVKYEDGDIYRLNIDAEQGHFEYSEPEEILHFSAADQVMIIQKELGIEQTGVWDTATNENFALWLRMQQAEHMVTPENQDNINKVADGWWGKNTQAGLEGNINPEMFNAVKGLYEREGGGLRNLTRRTRIHNASFEEVEAEIEAANFPNKDVDWKAAIPAGGVGLVAEAVNKAKAKGADVDAKGKVTDVSSDAKVKPVETDAKVKASSIEVGSTRTVKPEVEVKPQAEVKAPVEAKPAVAEFKAAVVDETPKPKVAAEVLESVHPQGKLVVEPEVKPPAVEVDAVKVVDAVEAKVVAPEVVTSSRSAVIEPTISDVVVADDLNEPKIDVKALDDLDVGKTPNLGDTQVISEVVQDAGEPHINVADDAIASTNDVAKGADVLENTVVDDVIATTDNAVANVATAEKVLDVADETLDTARAVVVEAVEEAPVAQFSAAVVVDEVVEEAVKAPIAPVATVVPEVTNVANASEAIPSGATSITLPALETAEESGGFLSKVWSSVVDSDVGKYLGKGLKTVGRALPVVGAGVATSDVAFAGIEAQSAIDAGLVDEGAMIGLGAGYTAHIAQGGLDPTLFGGEVGTLAAFEEVNEAYNIDPVLGSMIRPMLLIDLGDDLFGDGMPELDDEQIELLSNKYSDASMAPMYGMIIEKYGLPATVNIEGTEKGMPITEAVRNEEILENLGDRFDAMGNDLASDGLDALSFATRAQDMAQTWVGEYNKQQELENGSNGMSQEERVKSSLPQSWVSP